ncbi:MAG: ATP-dependent DNA helicase RecG [Firmicutes bacterium]|nr:ATP-dependent DNA helicase RecG [Bacillota bacterium]MCL5038300.1 ATP-dependent DNA helicase RecG [Bacillota bacterium]
MPARDVADLSRDIQYLKGVGPARARLLGKLGLHTVADLLFYFPRRYEDRSQLKAMALVRDGEISTVQGKVVEVSEVKPRPGLIVTRVAISDGSGTAFGIWFNQSFIKDRFRLGQAVVFNGRIERRYGQVQINKPEYEDLDDDSLHTGRIVPIYPLTEGLFQRQFRALMKGVVEGYASFLGEVLPEEIRQRLAFSGLSQAVRDMHFPRDLQAQEAARRRLAFEELFYLQLGLARLKRQAVEEEGTAHRSDGPWLKALVESLPFSLTEAQKRVIGEIRQDMESPRPMNRLIQGDVGSGKTVVAAWALVKAAESGFQAALMAPTEILAEQHFLNLKGLLSPLGITVGFLTGSLGRAERIRRLETIRSGELKIVVGTQALIQEGVEFARLSLVVTDEQHRFGVQQRALLRAKGYSPDVLVMTATPIPRTLSMTLYGDLDVSILDEMPPGRGPVETYWRRASARKKAYRFLHDQVKAGRQGYVVCPLIEESERLQAEAATDLAIRLRSEFPDLRIGLLHGRMRTEEKEETMEAFRQGHLGVLVSTTVIEVGVDVPNATVMVVEGANRFGLAQLHQLRGRVGRGREKSYCILLAEGLTEEGRRRLEVMQETGDGFAIAEEDLKLRGPGEFFGTRQHGLPDLRVADPIRDLPLLDLARQEAFRLIERDPNLTSPEHRAIRERVGRLFQGQGGLISVS